MPALVTDRLDRTHAAVLVIDFQQKLVPTVQECDQRIREAARLISAAHVLGVPVFAVEQYPAGLGKTDVRIASLLKTPPFEKLIFSGWTADVEKALGERFHRVLVGIETHVCVQLTALDMVRAGKRVWVCADATGSRRDTDRDMALERLRQAGVAVTTVESAILELLHQAGTQEFRDILKLVK
jgi:nicotinamidase-related amidase